MHGLDEDSRVVALFERGSSHQEDLVGLGHGLVVLGLAEGGDGISNHSKEIVYAFF